MIMKFCHQWLIKSWHTNFDWCERPLVYTYVFSACGDATVDKHTSTSVNTTFHLTFVSIKCILVSNQLFFPQQLHALTMAIDIYYDAIWTHNVEAIKPLKRLAGRLVNYLFSTGIDLLNTEKSTSSDVRDPSSTLHAA